MNERPDTAPVEGEARSRLSRIQHDLAVELARTRDLGSGLARCLDAALAAAEVEAGGIYVTEEATGDLVLLVHRGLSAEFVDEVRRVPRDSVRGRIAESRTGAFASLRDSDRTMLAAEAREGLTFCGTVTLWDQERVVGSLNVASGGPAELSAAARDALETIAAEATQAIVRLAADERVREQERNFRAFFETIDDIILVAATDGRVVYANPAAEQKLGYTAEELRRLTVAELHPAGVREEAAAILAAMLHGERDTCPLPLARKDGSPMPAETRVWFGEWSGRRCLFGRSKDLTAEQEAKQRFERLFRHNPLPMALSTLPERRFADVNDAWLAFFGFGRSDVIGRTSDELGISAEPRRHDAAAGELRERGVLRDFEMRVRTPAGELRDGLFSGETVRSQGKEYFLTVMVDLTERRRAEEALAEEATRRRILVEESRDGIVVLNEDGGVFEANRRFAEMLGYSPEEVRSLRVWDWDRNWEPEQVREAIRALGREGRSFETRHWRKDGSSFDVELSKSAAELGGRKLVFCVCRDISGRKRLESIREVLLSLGGQLNRTTDAPSASRALLGAADRLWAWDAAVVHLLEGDRGRSRRVLCIDTVDGVRREMPTAVMELSPRARRVVEAGAQLTLRTSETEGAGGGLPFGDLERRSWSIMDVPIHRDDQIVGVFSLHNHRKGAYTRDDLVVMQALADFCGGALERIRSEETARETSERLRQTQKLEAIGQLAGGVAHDFNNILAAMMMNLGLLEQEPGLGGEVRKSLRELEEEAQRAAGLTRQLLMFSRRSVLAPTPLDLNEVVDNLLKMLRRLIGEQIALRFDGATSLPLVQADAGMMEQVVMNLVVNARDAMPEGGRLVLATGVVSRTAEEANGHPNARPGRFVCLTVTDTGCGMTPETMGRIFEPFFTTKRQGEGTGLGLATVHGIVAQHQGWVEVESTVGRGAVFRVLLPVLPETRPVARAIDPRLPPKRGRESLLIVEDDAILRQVTEHALRALGYRVKAVANGPEAIQWWATAGTPVDLVLTDMVMPEGMTGLELVERLRESRPGLKAIVTSGYSAEITRPGVLAKAGVAYLPKPYEARSLAEILRAVLDGPPAGQAGGAG